MSLPTRLLPLRQLCQNISRCTPSSSLRNYSVAATEKPMRYAIIGSGPAACYTAMYLRRARPNDYVDMYEKWPVPYGLVRYGVAPDHYNVKNCIFEFEALGRNDNFRFIGNVEVGKDISLEDIRSAYDAVVFAYGSSEDRKLGIPGEDTVEDIFAARDFVGWYNSQPGCEKLPVMLDDVEEVAIIGMGNVAMDCARILLTEPKKLKATDIAPHAYEQLQKSRVKFVRIIGRRGFMQARFTAKELRELYHIKGASFVRDMFFNTSICPTDIKDPELRLTRPEKRLCEMWHKQKKLYKHTYPDIPVDARATWTLDFLQSPTKFIGDKYNRLEAVQLRKNKITPHLFNRDGIAVPKEPAELNEVTAHMALRAIGYKGVPIPGMDKLGVHFDDKVGKITNFDGRAQDPEGNAVPGVYCSGWIKTGPTGVIADTLRESHQTAVTMVEDIFEGGMPTLGGEGGWEAIKSKVEDKGIRWTDWEDWQKIRKYEFIDSETPRKVPTVAKMLEMLPDRRKK